MFKGLGQLGDMAKMMKAAKDMQERMAALQEDLGRIVVTGEAGAGLVQARATARGELTGLNIDPSILVASEKEIVEDLILAAIKDAQRRAQDKAAEEMARLTSELGLPADMNLPPL
jgi:DNA-binding YbaB/EbfC family protein